MGSRFALVVLITYRFTSVELGVFGMFSTSILLGVQLLGFDYYVFTSRELLKDGINRIEVLSNQLLFQGTSFLLSIPLIFPLFNGGFLDWSYAIVFYSILFFELVSGEQFRLLTLFGRSLEASILFFIKSASWVCLIPVFWLAGNEIFMNTFLCWLIGLLVAVGYGCFILKKDVKKQDFNFNLKHIQAGLKVSIPFFVSTILLKITEYSNRYVIDYSAGKSELGIFTFYSNFSTILSTVVFTLVIMPQYPNVLKAFLQNSVQDQISVSSKLLKDTYILTLILIPFVSIAVWGFVYYYKSGIYSEDFSSFLILIVSSGLACVNYATHYILYGKKRDLLLVFSYLAGSVTTIVFSFMLIPTFKLIGASIAGLLGFLVIVSIQFLGIWKANKQQG